MVDKKYEIIDHTADTGIRAFGNTPEELFINAACGMFDILADIKDITAQQDIKIDLKAENYEGLLVEWLRELLYQYNVSGIIFVKFSFSKISPAEIHAVVSGAKAPDKIKTEIKAVTYHGLELKQSGSVLQAQIIFDV